VSAPTQMQRAARQSRPSLTVVNTQDSPITERYASRPKQRKTHFGYFRVSEEAIRLIHRSFDKPCVTRAALLAYQVLCRIANLRGSQTFEVSIRSLSQDMAFEYREGQRALGYVETVGLVHIRRRKVSGTKENAPSIYTLVTMLPEATTSEHKATTSREDEVCGTSPQLTQEQIQSIHSNNI
jgi:hypothetical protein